MNLSQLSHFFEVRETERISTSRRGVSRETVTGSFVIAAERPLRHKGDGNITLDSAAPSIATLMVAGYYDHDSQLDFTFNASGW